MAFDRREVNEKLRISILSTLNIFCMQESFNTNMSHQFFTTNNIYEFTTQKQN